MSLNEVSLFLVLAEAGLDTTTVLLMCLIVFLAIITPVLARRRKKEVPRLDDVRETVAEQQKLRRTADKALVDLLETSREISAQIDTKIRLLNKLTKDADAQARRLERLLGQTKTQPDAARDKGPEVDLLAEENADESRAVDLERPRRTASGRWMRDVHRRIQQLHESGKDIPEIARRTHLSVEEVGLVLHMLSEAANNESA